MTPLERAINACHGPSGLARRVGESPQTINNWRRRGVPGDKCRLIEAATSGVVTCEQLRPDIFVAPRVAEVN